MAATLADIAKEAGVSEMTVSAVLRHKYIPKLPSAVARSRDIHAIAERLGYRPSAAAKAMVGGRYNCVGLLLGEDPFRSTLPAALLQGILRGVAEKDLHFTAALLPDQKLTDTGYIPRILREVMADGLLVNYTHTIPSRMLELIHKHRVPAVFINAPLRHDCVRYNDTKAAADLARLMIRFGHRRVLYADLSHALDEPDLHYSARQRCKGFLQAMRRAGGVARVAWRPTLGAFNSRAWAGQILASSDRPSAIITYSETHLVGIALAAADLGLSIPRDLSIASFCGGSPTIHLGQRITSALIPESEAGVKAVEMLIGRMKTGRRKPAVVLPMAIDLGQTAGPYSG